MPASRKSASMSKFPLRLMPSVRKGAESFSAREGVSLNQFINIAVAEKLAHLQHEEWIAQRPKVSRGLIAKALSVLDHSSNRPSDESDQLPSGYKSARRKTPARRINGNNEA